MMKTDRLEWRSRKATEFLIGNLKGLSLGGYGMAGGNFRVTAK